MTESLDNTCEMKDSVVIMIFISYYLLWGNIKRHSSEVNLLVRVYARKDEEDARTFSSSRPESAESEDYCSLILLHHFDAEAE